jgi:hypothetical protein
MSSKEYEKVRNYSSCSYNTLGKYSNGQGSGTLPGVMAPILPGVPSMQTTVVPAYGGMSYDTLTGGPKFAGCGGYFDITTAYPNYPNCTKNTTRHCTGYGQTN